MLLLHDNKMKAFSNRANIGNRSLQQEVVELIRLNPRLAKPWILLGYLMEEEEEISIDGSLYTKQECFIEALRHNEHNTHAWNNLGFMLIDDETACVHDKTVTNLECFLRAVQSDLHNSAAWNNLGFILYDDETVLVNQKEFGKRRCFLESLSLKQTETSAWNNTGKTLKRFELLDIGDGNRYSNKDCFITALKHDPTNSAAWFNLALALEEVEDIEVSEKLYNRCGCLVEAINEDPVYVDAWVEVAIAMPPGMVLQVENRDLRPKDCVVVGLKIDPDHVRGWEVIAGFLDDNETFVLREGDTPLTKQGCLQKSEKLDAEAKARGPRRPHPGRPARTTVHSSQIDKTSDFVSKVESKPSDPRSWYDLARSLKTDETVNIDGKEHTRLDCYVRSIKEQPKSSHAWNNLGALMLKQHSGMIEIEKLEYRAIDAFARAAVNDPHNQPAWKNMSKLLREKKSVVMVGDVEVDREMALAAANGNLPSRKQLSVKIRRARGVVTPRGSSSEPVHARVVVQSHGCAILLKRSGGREKMMSAFTKDVATRLGIRVELLYVTALRAGSLILEIMAPKGTNLDALRGHKCSLLAKEVMDATGVPGTHLIQTVTQLPSGGATCSVTVRGFAVDTDAAAVGNNGTVSWPDTLLNVAVPAPATDRAHIVLRFNTIIWHKAISLQTLKSNEWNKLRLDLGNGASVVIELHPDF